MRNPTDQDDFGSGPQLWDATPGVCCAAFQLGACPHTEAFDEERDVEPMTEAERHAVLRLLLDDALAAAADAGEPF